MTLKDKEGRWLDAAGEAVPVRYVKKIDKLRDALVEKLNNKAYKLNEQITNFKETAFKDVEDFLEKVEKEYNTSIKTAKGNKTLTNFSGNKLIEIRMSPKFQFDEKIALAKGLIDDCIKRWSKTSDTKIIILIERAFRVDKQGNIDAHYLLNLKNLNIKDTNWQKAMAILTDSLKVVSVTPYIRFRRKEDSNNKWETIPINIAQV